MDVTPVLVVVILAGAIVLDRLSRRAIDALFRRGVVPPRIVAALETAVRWMIVFVGLYLILRELGISRSAVVTSLSAVALTAAVAFFAYWSVLSNGLCSVLLLLFTPFRIGDRIEIREHDANRIAYGEVLGINPFFVTLGHVDEEGVESQFRVPSNLFFQKATRRWPGADTTGLIQAYRDGRSARKREEVSGVQRSGSAAEAPGDDVDATDNART